MSEQNGTDGESTFPSGTIAKLVSSRFPIRSVKQCANRLDLRRSE